MRPGQPWARPRDKARPRAAGLAAAPQSSTGPRMMSAAVTSSQDSHLPPATAACAPCSARASPHPPSSMPSRPGDGPALRKPSLVPQPTHLSPPLTQAVRDPPVPCFCNQAMALPSASRPCSNSHHHRKCLPGPSPAPCFCTQAIGAPSASASYMSSWPRYDSSPCVNEHAYYHCHGMRIARQARGA